MQMQNISDWTAEQLPSSRPSTLIITDSGGKDSQLMTELVVRAFKTVCPIIIHHQFLPENWQGTDDLVCDHAMRLGVPVVIQQPDYTRYICHQCRYDGLFATARLAPAAAATDGKVFQPHCAKCHSLNIEVVGQVRGIHDLNLWRKRFASPSVRFCTSYAKEAVLNSWCSQHREELGANPYVVMGERWKESSNRQLLQYEEQRSGKKWIKVWHPILHLSRREVFRGLRELGLEPHYCYALQWRSQGLSEAEIEWEMYESENEKGGPRCSCIDCFYAVKYMGSNLKLEQNASHLEWHQNFAATHQHDPQLGLSLAMILEGKTAPVRSNPRIQRVRKLPPLVQPHQLSLF